MTDHFVIDMLPAREGDCLWIEYGDASRPQRILVDGGRQIAYDTLKARFAELPEDQREFELLVCTHVDADHIEGLLKLVEDPDLPVTFRDVWYNSYVHLKQPNGFENFGAKQGERFADGLVDRQWRWNSRFGGHSVVVPDDGLPPSVDLADGMSATILSPTWPKLERFSNTWLKECKEAGIVPGIGPTEEQIEGFESLGSLNEAEVRRLAATPEKRDSSNANGSSIALLLEFKGKRLLLAGDAHADVLTHTIERLNAPTPLKLDALKLSHHGSHGCVSASLFDALDCSIFLVSSNGSRYNHPDRETIAKLLTSFAGAKELRGNYRSDEMQQWDQRSLRSAFDFSLLVPDAEDGILRTRLI